MGFCRSGEVDVVGGDEGAGPAPAPSLLPPSAPFPVLQLQRLHEAVLQGDRLSLLTFGCPEV